MATFAFYQLRLWRKHLLQHQAILDLALPEMGLQGGESAIEERLLDALLRGLGIPVRLRAECQRRYGNEQRRGDARRLEISSKSMAPNSFYVAASRFLVLFDRIITDAGVSDDRAFLGVRDRLLFQTLFDLGVYYNIFGQEAMQDVVKLYQDGNFDKTLGAEPPDGALWKQGEAASTELNLECFAHARRALQAIGAQEFHNLSAVQNAPPLARFMVHRFTNLISNVLGLPVDLSWALGFFQGTKLVDQAVLAQLDSMVAGEAVSSPENLSPDIASTIEETMRRLALSADAIEQAWNDGVFDPEEILILRYSLLHLFGLGEDIAARFIGTREKANRLVAALRGKSVNASEEIQLSEDDMIPESDVEEIS
jgi:hypothetical protein